MHNSAHWNAIKAKIHRNNQREDEQRWKLYSKRPKEHKFTKFVDYMRLLNMEIKSV